MIRQAFTIAFVIALVLPAFTLDAQRNGAPAEAANNQANAPLPAATLQLDDAVREALQKNPAVQSALHLVEAQRRRAPQARALPDPTLSVGWMGDIAPFKVQNGDPSSYRSVSAMQMLPYPGKLKLRGEIAGKEAEAAYWDYEAVRRRVTADVKSAYYDYFFFDKALLVTQRSRELLLKLSGISEARYRVGKAVQQDVLKSQVEVSMLLQRLTTLELQRATAQARLNALLARPPESPLPAPAEVKQTALSASLEQLFNLARQNETGLQRERQMVERNQLAVSLARREYYPDFSVGYMYQQRPLMPDMNGFTFTVNVPVFYKSKQREAEKQAAEELTAAEQSRDSRQNELYFELKQQYLTAKASEQLLSLYSKGVVPQSSLTLESSMAAYQVGNVDFLTILTNFATVLNYEVEYYRELANYQTALARMEALTGADLTGAQPLPDTSAAQEPERK